MAKVRAPAPKKKLKDTGRWHGALQLRSQEIPELCEDLQDEDCGLQALE